MDGFVRVTLTQPYAFGREGKNLPIPMRYGYTEARATMIEDEYGRARSKSIPGKPIEHTLDWDNPNRRSIIMPELAARMYFGHWDLPETSDGIDHLEIAAGVTTDTERTRVANNWGGYVSAKLDSDNKKNYLLPLIDVPKVPHVLISDVNAETDFSFDPWERYKWEAYLTPLDQLPPSMQLPPGYVNPNAPRAQQAAPQMQGYTEAQMQAMIGAAVAKALEAATAPQKKAV